MLLKFVFELNELKFNSLNGIGNPYQQVFFKVGNANGFSTTTYVATINILGQASLLNLIVSNTDPLDEPTLGYKGTEATLLISNGVVNGTAKIKMNINLSANAWPPSTANQAFLSYNGGSVDVNSNGDTFVDVNLDSNGECLLNFSIGISLLDLPVTGDITFDLLEINGDSGLVSATNQQIININY